MGQRTNGGLQNNEERQRTRFEDSVCFCGRGKSEVAHGIDGRIIDANFIVHVRSGRTATDTDVADNVATLYVNTRRNCEGGQMAVPSSHAKTVIDDHQAAIARMQPSFDYHAVGCSAHTLSIFRRDIDTGMKCTFTTEWIKTFAEICRYAPYHRPQRRAERHLSQGKCGHYSRTGVSYRSGISILGEKIEFLERMVNGFLSHSPFAQPKWARAQIHEAISHGNFGG